MKLHISNETRLSNAIIMEEEAMKDLQGSLRPDFFHGYATAATQVEGAWNQDGKGLTIWDTFAHTSGRAKVLQMMLFALMICISKTSA